MTDRGAIPGRTRPAGPGKWPVADLARLLDRYVARDPARVPLGPGIGLDAAVVRLGGTDLIVASDPVTFATDRIGTYAVVVNANDVAVCGAEPRFFTAVLLLPVEVGGETVEAIFADLAGACRRLGVLLVGGHTERTAGLDRPIVAGTMIGDLQGRPPLSPGGARPGDAVVLAGGAAVEATALVARERADALARCLDADLLARARAFLDDPGICVVAAARAARKAGARALHDVTEGGVVAAFWEMAEAAGLGIEVEADAVPLRPETRAVCEAAGIDPLEAIGSGALVAAVPQDGAEALVRALESAGTAAAVVGRFGPPGGPRTLRRGGRAVPLVPPERDAVARLFD